ncbi:MAG: hypothetical protein ACRDK7_16135 [Solirubrobacteraceae bacterium]
MKAPSLPVKVPSLAGRARVLRPATLLLASAAVAAIAAGLLAGCGSSSGSASTPAAERLQREDLVAVARALRQAEPSAAREMASARVAWPLVANGLPGAANNGLPGTANGLPATDTIPPATHAALAAASRAAHAILVPPLLRKPAARSLTGPAAGIAGLFQSSSGLIERGWTLTTASSAEISSGSPAASRFARENVALYIDSVYDGHFLGGQLGKSLLKAYTSLAGTGGASAFGRALTPAEVSALARFYSPANLQLHPHSGVKLGS